MLFHGNCHYGLPVIMRTMIPKCTLYLLLWSSFLGVDSQPTVYTEFLTPEADRKEGGEVLMRCMATNLLATHVVEWNTMNQTLSWGETIYASVDHRYSFDSQWPMSTVNIKELSITDLQRKDANDFICNVRYLNPTGGAQVIATDKLTLSVLYFPSESFPICSPNGTDTVLLETIFKMKCSSEIANPEVSIDVTTDQTGAFIWSSSSVDDTVLRSLDLSVGVSEDGLQFTCTITSPIHFQGMSRSCTIGPIHVVTLTIHAIPTTEPNTLQTPQATANPPIWTTSTAPATVTTPTTLPGLTTSILVGSLAGGVALLLLILVIYALCLCKRKQKPHTTVNNTQPQNTETMSIEPRHGDNTLYKNTRLRPQTIPEEPAIYQNVHRNSNSECRFPGSEDHNSNTTGSAGVVDRSSFYAKPNKVRKNTLDSTEKRRRQDQAAGVSTEQSYFNPVFDSGDLDSAGCSYRTSTVDVIPKSQTTRRASRPTEDRLDPGGYSKPDIQMLPSGEGTGPREEHPNGGRHVRIATPQMNNGPHRKTSSPRYLETVDSHPTPRKQNDTRRPSTAVAYAEINLLSEGENGRRLAPTDSPDYAVLNESS